MSRILRLALLAPDLVEAILGGWADQRVKLEKLERPLPVWWEEQRAALPYARSDKKKGMAYDLRRAWAMAARSRLDPG